MLNYRAYFSAALFLLVGLTGCATKGIYWDSYATHQGPASLLEREPFEKIDLALILYSDIDNHRCYGKEGREKTECLREAVNSQSRLAEAFDKFYKKTKKRNYKLSRNRVQDRIIAGSNLRCANFKQFLGAIHEGNTFLLGTLTTGFAGAASVFTNEAVSRSLAGAAALASGIDAEYNKAYLAQKNVQVIVTGFERRRARILKEMRDMRSKTLEEYTVEAAVADAIAYHDACSLVAGLEEVARDQKRPVDVGVDEFIRLYEQLNESMAKLRQN